MYLSQLRLNNFRSFADEQVMFQQGLTVLIGENNGGKSNIIDAVRLITTPLSGRRDLYCEQTDVRFGLGSRRFEIEAEFECLTPPQQGRLFSATTDDSLSTACFGLTYDLARGDSRVRPTLWAGRFKAPPEAGAHEMVRHVYLPPLRDAKRALASGNPTRIYALLNHFLGKEDSDEVARRLARTPDHQILSDVDAAVATGLNTLTGAVRPQCATLGFSSDERLIDIARDLRFKLADQGIEPEELQYSGHGLANLLYIATVAVELEKTDDVELTLFLVEEPEAHLHPQLQAAVLSFLEQHASQSLRRKENQNAPAGHVQVVVATHSPNLSAWVPSKRLVYVRSVLPATELRAPRDSQETQTTPSLRPESRCIPLCRLDLSDLEHRKIDRYLDVTKSALLFGGRVLLVEGIAEALLIPAIAKYHVLKHRPADLRKFGSAVLVPIDGVDFCPYVKALLSPFNNVRITDRVVIVTDGDKHTVEKGRPTPGKERKTTLEMLATNKGASALLAVFVSTYSLETELVAAGNDSCLREIYLTLHPRSEDKWGHAVAKVDDERAKLVQELFKATPKGDFAQLLAEKIASSGTFVVPDYISQAIEALVA